jgi:hypothetical protein
MDGLQDQLIDISLNTLGYLIAGLLGMVIYSIANNRRSAGATASQVPKPSPSRAKASAAADVEFLNLRQLQNSSSRDSKAAKSATAPSNTSSRRDRTEVIRIAREMVKAGTSTEMIKRTLPISDGELALIQQGSKR